jgi:selenocysteine lyase/cysteine desulfurase
MLTRRSFLGSGAVAGFALAGARPLDAIGGGDAVHDQAVDDLNRPSGAPDIVARDEAYWRRVAAHYRVSDAFTNLEAGYFGMMAAPVLAAHHRLIDRVNLESSHYARRGYPADLESARGRVAAFLGVTPGEIAFSRGATEALQCLIGQYNKVGPGDTVMYADLDYNAMQYAMDWLVQRRGAVVARLTIPEPATRDSVLAAYTSALDANPRTKLVLLTHLNNKTGLVIPVKEIASLARARGADVVVDAAHSFGQMDLKIADLGADFVGCNLHKWIGAPVGAGVLYIKAGRLGDVDRMMADPSGSETTIDNRIHTGTANFATFLTVPHALDFHDAVGPAYKAARIRYLRDRWVSAVRGVRGIDVLTPDDRDLVAGITSFRLHGRTGRAENQAVAAELLNRHRLFTTWRTGLAQGDCVRVTPALYNAPGDLDRLAGALESLAARG